MCARQACEQGFAAVVGKVYTRRVRTKVTFSSYTLYTYTRGDNGHIRVHIAVSTAAVMALFPCSAARALRPPDINQIGCGTGREKNTVIPENGIIISASYTRPPVPLCTRALMYAVFCPKPCALGRRIQRRIIHYTYCSVHTIYIPKRVVRKHLSSGPNRVQWFPSEV